MSEYLLFVIAALQFGILWELRKICQHVDTSRRIAYVQHFGEAPSD